MVRGRLVAAGGRGVSELPPAVAAYFACINAEDWAGLAEAFAPDAVIRPVGSEPRSGREAVVAYYPAILAGFGPHLDEVVRPLVAGDTVTVELRFTGETRTGVPVRFDGVDVFDLDASGRIRHLAMWYDTADVNRQVRRETRRT